MCAGGLVMDWAPLEGPTTETSPTWVRCDLCDLSAGPMLPAEADVWQADHRDCWARRRKLAHPQSGAVD